MSSRRRIFLLWWHAVVGFFAWGLSPLPSGISAVRVSRGGQSRAALQEVRALVLKAFKAARAANETLLEVEFPPLLGLKTDFVDVDNVQILDANRDWAMETAAELVNDFGDTKSLWLAFPDRRELELAKKAWPGQAFKRATMTTIEDAAATLKGEESIEQPWGAQLSRLVAGEDVLGAKPEDLGLGIYPDLIVAVQPGDGGPLEDWLNLELLGDRPLLVCNGAFDKLRGGYYPPFLFPKLAKCVDRFIANFETLFYLKALNDKGRSGWIYRVYPENWQVIEQDRHGDDTLLFDSPTKPSYADAVTALLGTRRKKKT
mmetsp:Transcript_10607/g.35084  ORF Transcript_10607/g.35084 Transcript_10607/m.35084 type:complete len:316 (+) Transcript_10607:1261-2208(+)